MKKIYFSAMLFLMLICTQNTHAQNFLSSNKPNLISAEDFIGDKRQFFQIMVNKVFLEKKKIGLFSISSFAADHNENLPSNEYLNTTLIYHHLFNGVSINSGATFSSFEGLKSFVGLQYMHQFKSFSLIYIPTYYFIKAHKISNIALLEYKPSINERWSVFTRLQVHYNYDLEKGNHFRSYVYSRVGLSFKNFSFGIAHNFDSYGEEKTTKSNYGVFLNLSI